MRIIAIGLAALALANGAAAKRVGIEKQDVGRVPGITMVVDPERLRKPAK